jgi:hypothetical protein
MKKAIVVGSLLMGVGGVGSLHARTGWFNVMGDPQDTTVNTIEVDPIPVAVNGDLKTMKIRVSRSVQRTSWDGVPYRSYTSTVVFDCANKSAQVRVARLLHGAGVEGRFAQDVNLHRRREAAHGVSRRDAQPDAAAGARRLPHRRREEVAKRGGALLCHGGAGATMACRLRIGRVWRLILQKGLHAATHCIGRRR